MWNKVSDSIEKEIDGELMYNKTFLKAKIAIKKCLREAQVTFL